MTRYLLDWRLEKRPAIWPGVNAREAQRLLD